MNFKSFLFTATTVATTLLGNHAIADCKAADRLVGAWEIHVPWYKQLISASPNVALVVEKNSEGTYNISVRSESSTLIFTRLALVDYVEGKNQEAQQSSFYLKTNDASGNVSGVLQCSDNIVAVGAVLNPIDKTGFSLEIAPDGSNYLNFGFHDVVGGVVVRNNSYLYFVRK